MNLKTLKENNKSETINTASQNLLSNLSEQKTIIALQHRQR